MPALDWFPAAAVAVVVEAGVGWPHCTRKRTKTRTRERKERGRKDCNTRG
jgi:hypothetical protein